AEKRDNQHQRSSVAAHATHGVQPLGHPRGSQAAVPVHPEDAGEDAGVTPPMPRREAGAIRLSTPKVTDADRERFAAIVGESFISDDADQRLPRARGKSYLDLLDWRADKEIAAPDLVVAPADEEQV